MSRTLQALKRIESRERTHRPAETVCVAAESSPTPGAPLSPVAVASPVAADVSLQSTTADVMPQAASETCVERFAFSDIASVVQEESAAEEPQYPSGQPSDPEECRWPDQPTFDVSYERLVKNLLAQRVVGRPASLMFTSPGDGDGKTELLLSLAPLLAARAGRAVILVDADYRKGDLSARLANFNEGWAGLLLGTANLAEVVCPTSVPQLAFLPSGVCQEPGCVLDDATSIEGVLDDLKCAYGLVLLDAPSLAHANVATMASYCDGICLVVRPGHTLRRAVHEAAMLLDETGGQLLGCVSVGEQMTQLVRRN